MKRRRSQVEGSETEKWTGGEKEDRSTTTGKVLTLHLGNPKKTLLHKGRQERELGRVRA